eukprot:EG_transcript_35915
MTSPPHCVFLEHVPKDGINTPSPPLSPKDKFFVWECGVLAQRMPSVAPLRVLRTILPHVPPGPNRANPTTSPHCTASLPFSTVPSDGIGTPCHLVKFPNTVKAPGILMPKIQSGSHRFRLSLSRGVACCGQVLRGTPRGW